MLYNSLYLTSMRGFSAMMTIASRILRTIELIAECSISKLSMGLTW